MNQNKILNGSEVSLDDMLYARERRQMIQQSLIQKYNLPLISFTLNIVGPLKVFPLVIKTYEEGISLIKSYCFAWGLHISHFQEICENTGYEGFFVINADSMEIKNVTSQLELKSSIGRLFDIDVIKVDGKKVSRTELNLSERKCLLCNKNAFECSRSRTHSVNALVQREIEVMWDYFTLQYAKDIASIATRSLLYEVITTPKPGLVDKHNNGSHKDMDIYTFESSALALMPYFIEFVQCGIHNCNLPPKELMDQIRPIGIQAELAMLHATNGINTHKGIIFSLGIICTALGYLYGQQIDYSQNIIRNICKKMTSELMKDFDRIEKSNAITNGEKLYAEYGIMGVRGESMNGFPNVFSLALPIFRKYTLEGFTQNDSGILTLLHLIAFTEDTNIISRSDYNTMLTVQKEIKNYLENTDCTDYIDYIQKLDHSFIDKNISPGGCADLLALTYFIYFYETELEERYGF